MNAMAIDWREAPTEELDYARPVDFEQVIIMQEDAQSIEPLPASPLPPLEPVRWLERLMSPPWRPRIPWAALVAFVLTLVGMAAAYSTR